MFIKPLILLSCLATFAGNSWAAPVASDVSLATRVLPRAAPPAGATPCSNDDQTDADADDPDKDLPSCADLGGSTPFPCTNDNLVAFKENLPFCNGTTLQDQGPAAVAAASAAEASASAVVAAFDKEFGFDLQV
ncbi:hypothetical protein B0H16DRAFT_1700527 [Mycena metata]|uniref:Uncharacterized protein n=1 Tax=Mycena metata TaxID=1033252 RepID=A0AAD7HF78_9AGAR|nr:hypothetical protein B0H16DRAFT_1700527 [Mycena metata]